MINFDKNVINIDQNIQKQINQLLNMNNKKIGGEGNTEAPAEEKTKKINRFETRQQNFTPNYI